MNGFFAGWKPKATPEGYSPGPAPMPLPGWSLVVVGGDSLPEPVIHSRLDLYASRYLGTHRITVISPGDSEAVSVWCKRCSRVSHQLEHEDRNLGRCAAARQAIRMVAAADAVVIFGDVGRWWRVQRYAADAGVPVRVVKRHDPGG